MKNGLGVLREVDTDEIVETIDEIGVKENRGRVRPGRNGYSERYEGMCSR